MLLSYSHLQQENVPDYGIPWVGANTGPLADYSGMRPPVDQDNFYGLLARDYEDTRTEVATAQVEHDLTPTLTLRNHARYGRTYRDSVITSPRFADVNSPTEYTCINRNLQSRDMTDTILSNKTSLSARSKTGGLSHAVMAGIELARDFPRTSSVRSQARRWPTVAPDPHDPYTGRR